MVPIALAWSLLVLWSSLASGSSSHPWCTLPGHARYCTGQTESWRRLWPSAMGCLHLLPLGSIGFIIFTVAKLGKQRFWINIPKIRSHAMENLMSIWWRKTKCITTGARHQRPSWRRLFNLNAILTICTHPWHPANLAMPECPKIPFGLWCSGMEGWGDPQHIDPRHLCHQGSFLTHAVCHMLFVLRIYKIIIHCKWFDNNATSLDFAHAIVHASFIFYLDESYPSLR